MQDATCQPSALIGGGPLNSRPPLRSPFFIGYRTVLAVMATAQKATLHYGRALPLRAPTRPMWVQLVAVRVQGLIPMAGATLASPPPLGALRPQISATCLHPHGALRHPTQAEPCPTLRYAQNLDCFAQVPRGSQHRYAPVVRRVG